MGVNSALDRHETITDCRGLRFKDLFTPEYRHLWLLLFWAGYAVVFTLIERYFTAEVYYPMHCAIDDLIPFSEIFVVPYVSWYFYLMFAHLYLLGRDVEAFKKMMRFFIITYAYAILFCLVFPNCQDMRPVSFNSDNILTRIMAVIYTLDTSTNVSPSMHVLGTCAATFALITTKGFSTPLRKAALIVLSVLICVSTVFVKQHSILDIAAAVPVCVAAWFACFGKTTRKHAAVKKRLGIINSIFLQ